MDHLVMQAFFFNRRFWLLAGLLLLVVPVAATLLAGMIGLEATSRESGPLELTQEVSLILAALLYAAAAVRQQQAERMASAGASVVAIVFFLRELELPATGPVTAYLDSSSFRWHEAVVVAAIAISYLALRWRLIPVFVQYLRELRAWPYVLVAALLVAGALIDGRHWLWGIGFLPATIEESFEAAAYLIFLLTSLHVYRHAAAASAKPASLRRDAGAGLLPTGATPERVHIRQR
jgi:predicted branched-subunit amino acid permease